MSFGTNPFGTTPFGGLSSESGGVTLVSANPAPNATGVHVDSTVQLVLYCPAEFNANTLQLSFNGVAVIRDGSFVPSYSGFIDFDGVNLNITVSVHPDFEEGSVLTVALSVMNLADETGSIGYFFNIGGASLTVSETLTQSVTLAFGQHANVQETLVLDEAISPFIAIATETLNQAVDLDVRYNANIVSNPILHIFESSQFGSLRFYSLDSTTVAVDFPEVMDVEGVADPTCYDITPFESKAFPTLVTSASPVQDTVQSGSSGQVQVSDSRECTSFVFDTVTGSFIPDHIGDYFYITGTFLTPGMAYRIVSYVDSVVTLSKELTWTCPENGTYVPPAYTPGESTWDPGTFIPGTGTLQWVHMKGARGAVLKIAPTTLGRKYIGSVHHLTRKFSHLSYEGSVDFEAFGVRPALVSVQYIPEDGSVLVSFDQDMRIDPDLLDTKEYSISGPSTVTVRDVLAIDPKTIVLKTAGFGTGVYTLTVNAIGTPKDESGNSIDPLSNEAIFATSIPIITRSIFTDRGPIAKAELTLQSGVGGSVQTAPTLHFGNVTLNELTLPGGVFNSSHVGKYLELSGSTVNSGVYQVLGVVNGSRLKVQASFHLPDSANGTLTWRLYDPRTGEIADSPSDVVVRVDGHIVPAQAVLGLLGQVILGAPPASDADVKIDYSWIQDPTIEVRRLNSKEFRLNDWANNVGSQGPTQHSYRYRNVLASPASYTATDVLANQSQPLFRELHYRAFERAYSVAFNDPNLLVFNTPLHRIGYPPLSRAVVEVSVSYSADVLPEVDATYPWERKGMGGAYVLDGNLVVVDNTTGPFPVGQPLFWTRGVDLTFPNVYASTWRLKVDSTVPDGVFTGLAVGWSDDTKVLVLGYLIDNGVRKIGFLKKGCGNDQNLLSSWMGGVDLNGDNTGEPFEFDWSILHSYRLFQDRDGVVRFYVDGEVVESLRALEDDLPFLEELNDPFDQVQNVFFGSISRNAQSVSTWDFVRYLVSPINPEQSTPSVFVSYEGDNYPETVVPTWTPIGYHGNEALTASSLLLDSTSATDAATESEVGLVGGDFRGFTRLEPLLGISSKVDLDFSPLLRTYTHGVAPNSVMAAIDDGNRLVQVSFFPSKSQPKLSYPGRSLPTAATPKPWYSLGGSAATMVGRVLRIEDSTTLDGRVFAISDLEPIGSDRRIIEAGLDWYAEVKFQVVSYVSDGSSENFCGATFDVFDGTRSIGLLLCKDPITNTLQVAFHSDGQLRSGSGAVINFNWNDGSTHVYRLVKNTSGSLVSLFVDNSYVGSYDYLGFGTATGDPTYSFGSATLTSMASKSVVDWHYANVWRAQPSTGVRQYVGIWKGTDSTTLLGYHLPLRFSGIGVMSGNVLTDTSTDFSSVQVGDDIVVDYGVNRGVYSVANVSAAAAGVLTLTTSFQPGVTTERYRVPSQVDWRTTHKYRVVRDPGGFVALFLDADTDPLIRVDYSEVTLPSSSVGVPYTINRGIPSISWGSFDPSNLSQTAWDYLRYGITNSSDSTSIVPHHQVMNQRNIMSSPEHLFGKTPHDHTQYSSSSTGVPNPWEDFADNPDVTAFTRLNEGTPLVPSTQTYEVRRPQPQVTFLSTLNDPADVLNGSFNLNDASTDIKLLVPNDVLYNSLQVIEHTTGEPDLIAPFSDEGGAIKLGKLSWQNTVCATYDATMLPEQDPSFVTPWVLASEDPSKVSTTISGGALTYSVGDTTARTVYRNATPLTDPSGLPTRVQFRLRLLNDATLGTGDSGVRFGFSALGLTATLAFVSTPLGEREVRLLDLNSGVVLGAISFDYLDGEYHTYRLVKNVDEGSLDFFIDP